MPDYSPINSDGGLVTLTAGGTGLTGGQLVKMSADDTVIPTAATADRAVGVAAHDVGVGGRVSVWLLPGYIHELPPTSAVAVAAGNAVVADANGRINTATLATAAAAGTLIGICVRGATGNAGGTAKARFLGV